jgi:hypothetical protein
LVAMRAHAAADEGGGLPRDRPTDAEAADDHDGLPAARPADAAAAPGPEQAVNPLQRLIQQRLRERGWSYGDVARRGGLPRSTVYTLAITRNLVRPPRPATNDGLAKGLDVPVSAVGRPRRNRPGCTTTTSPGPGRAAARAIRNGSS